MTNPVDIIAAAIHRTNCGGCPVGVSPADITRAKAAATALTLDGVVANAVQALMDTGYENQTVLVSRHLLERFARTVLASVGGDQ